MRIGCFIGQHRREARSVHDTGTHYASVCKHCGKPLIRNGHGRWIGASGSEAPVRRSQPGSTPVSAIEDSRGGPVKGRQPSR